jgi:hypothetical protein
VHLENATGPVDPVRHRRLFHIHQDLFLAR